MSSFPIALFLVVPFKAPLYTGPSTIIITSAIITMPTADVQDLLSAALQLGFRCRRIDTASKHIHKVFDTLSVAMKLVRQDKELLLWTTDPLAMAAYQLQIQMSNPLASDEELCLEWSLLKSHDFGGMVHVMYMGMHQLVDLRMPDAVQTWSHSVQIRRSSVEDTCVICLEACDACTGVKRCPCCQSATHTACFYKAAEKGHHTCGVCRQKMITPRCVVMVE